MKRDPRTEIRRDLGTGIGLRSVHYGHILSETPAVPWFEVISENYMGTRGGSGGRPVAVLDEVRKNYPVAMHGVSLSIGSTDPLNAAYLKRLRALARRIEPMWISDHVCWTGVHGQNLHDLLPLPYTRKTARHVADRILKVQDFLGRRISIENVSSYLSYTHSEMTEWEFITEVSERADCLILLDINNIHVSAVNHKFDAVDFIRGVPPERVAEHHLAGYSDMGTHLIDTHDHPVSDPVWALYETAVRRFGPVPTLIEWDDLIPEFSMLQKQAREADKIRRRVTNVRRDKSPVLA